MKRTLCCLLVLLVMSAALPASAADGDTANAAASSDQKPISAAMLKAGSDLSSRQTQRLAPQAGAQKVPASLPRGGSDRIRKQGGGKTGMIIGLVSSVVGVAATVYMVREMKKDNDQ
jgi:hypothetical protein